MSVRHSTHSQPQSLPPFAVAFSNSSLDKLSSHPASLPPIQPRPPSERPRSLPEPSQSAPMVETPPIPNGRKRSHPEVSQRDDTSSDNRCVHYLPLFLPHSLMLSPATGLPVVRLLTRVASRWNTTIRATTHPPTLVSRDPTPPLSRILVPGRCPLLHHHPSLNLLPRNAVPQSVALHT